MKTYKIGVIGSSEKDSKGADKAKQIGRTIAKSNCQVITGGCTGLPYAAVRGAKEKNGFTAGISPATNEEEHVNEYEYPLENHDLMIYTGFGFKGRNVILVRSCDAVIAISGRLGTMNELTISYSEKKVIGLLKGLPGAAYEFKEIEEKLGRPGTEVVEDNNPEKLVNLVLDRLEK